MQVSIITVNHNTRELLRNSLMSIYEKTTGVIFDVYVVDNGSIDGSQRMVKEVFPKVKLIENDANLGFAKANNIAIRKSNAKYCFLLNPDTMLLNNAVKIFFDFMEKEDNQDVACCGGSIYDESMTPRIAYGNFPSIKQIIFDLGLKHFFRNYYKNHVSITVESHDDSLKDVDYITGAAIFIRKTVLDKLGYLDEDFFLYYEDTELSYRMRENGFRAIIIPQAKIIHLIGQSQDSLSNQAIYFAEKSKYIYFEKCHGKCVKNLARILYILKYSLTFLIKRKPIYLQMLKATIKI